MIGEDFPRMTDKTHKPSEEEIESFVGEQAKEAWQEIRKFVESHYDFISETVFYGAKYGWTIRYRKSGKTLCSLFPEKGGFTVLIVLGKKEAEKALSIQNELNSKIKELLSGTEQLHDGQWLWIRVLTAKDTDDIKKLLQAKRKPKET